MLFPTIAEAEHACAAHDEIVNELAQRFKEAPEASGIALDGMLIEVFVSEARSWTILITSPKGISCIASAGRNWEDQSRKPGAGI